MRLAQSVLEASLRHTIPPLLPTVSWLSNERLLSLVPPIPLAGATGYPNLRALMADNVTLLNFFRHLLARPDRRRLKERLERHVIAPLTAEVFDRAQARRETGTMGLSSMVLSPGVECNLDCSLCYNRQHTDLEHKPSLEQLDQAVKQARALGAYRISIIGGEPLLRADTLLQLFRQNDNCLFTVMTNGTLLTLELAKALAALPNVELCFSVDGLEATHDASRGKGTYAQVTAAMALYRDAGGMLLYSPTITQENLQEVVSEPFITHMLELGAYMGYHHHYYMIGGQTRDDLLLTAEQLSWLKQRMGEVQVKHPILLFDHVFNPYFKGGCQAAREWVHINHRGEVEPCCMVPFAGESLQEKALVDILRGPFFQALRDQPADAQGIRPCLMGGGLAHLQQSLSAGGKPSTAQAMDSFGLIHHPAISRTPTCFSARA